MAEINLPFEGIRQEINDEHHLLQAGLDALGSACSVPPSCENCHACPAEQQKYCSEHVLDQVGTLLSYMVGHFHHEESLMRHYNLPDIDRDGCERHIQAHGDIAEAFGKLVIGLRNANPLPHVRELQSLLENWLQHHIAEHDQHLLSALRTSARVQRSAN